LSDPIVDLRAALIFAARRIVKLNFGRREDLSLAVLRRALREARVVARRFNAETNGHSRPIED
jgi:hypothetical protein